MTLMNVPAPLISSHGNTAIEMLRPVYAPWRMSMYLGNSPDKSIPVENDLNELSIVLMASWHATRLTPTKKQLHGY
jgi:hypothetical protein